MSATARIATLGHLLGGRVRHDQPPDGHRTGIEPVLLAASIPARAGQRVLEGGTGSGAALLCLAARVPGITGVGIEIDGALAEIARDNARANAFSDLSLLTGDLAAFTGAGAPFDHAFANPPYHRADGTPSPDVGRTRARHAGPDLLAIWAARLGAALRPRGTLTLIVAAASLPACLAACVAARCGSPAIVPLWPRAESAAKLVLLRTVRNGRGACRVLPGLALHEADGSYTTAAQAILRDGAPLVL